MSTTKYVVGLIILVVVVIVGYKLLSTPVTSTVTPVDENASSTISAVPTSTATSTQ